MTPAKVNSVTATIKEVCQITGIPNRRLIDLTQPKPDVLLSAARALTVAQLRSRHNWLTTNEILQILPCFTTHHEVARAESRARALASFDPKFKRWTLELGTWTTEPFFPVY